MSKISPDRMNIPKDKNVESISWCVGVDFFVVFVLNIFLLIFKNFEILSFETFRIFFLFRSVEFEVMMVFIR